MRDVRSMMLAAAAAVSILAAACGTRPEPPAKPAAEEHHPATIEEANKLAAERGVPVLVDFWSPT